MTFYDIVCIWKFLDRFRDADTILTCVNTWINLPNIHWWIRIKKKLRKLPLVLQCIYYIGSEILYSSNKREKRGTDYSRSIMSCHLFSPCISYKQTEIDPSFGECIRNEYLWIFVPRLCADGFPIPFPRHRSLRSEQGTLTLKRGNAPPFVFHWIHIIPSQTKIFFNIFEKSWILKYFKPRIWTWIHTSIGLAFVKR